MPDIVPNEDALRQLRRLVRKMRRQKPPITWSKIAAELDVTIPTAKKYWKAAPHPDRKSAITVQQRRYVAGVLDGKTKTQAAKDAGCPTPEAAHKFITRANQSVEVQDYMRGLLKRAGLDDDTLVKRLEECTRATKIAGVAVNKNTGMIQDRLEHPDFHVRHQALRTAFELGKRLGDKDEKNTTPQVQVFLTIEERKKLEILTGGPLAFPVIELEGASYEDVRPSPDGPPGGEPLPAARDLQGENNPVPGSHAAGD